MEKFLYKIEKNEKEENIELNLFCSNLEDLSTQISKKTINYTIIIKKEDFKALNIKSDKIVLANNDFLNKNKENLVKINIKSQELYKYLKNEIKDRKIEIFEGDLIDEHRYLIENEVKIIKNEPKSSLNLKYLVIDIETIGDLDNLEIISISTYSPQDKNISKVYVNQEKLKDKNSLNKFKSKDFDTIILANEKKLLEMFKSNVIKFAPQLITGWNVIDFDFKVIRDRMKEHNIEFKFSKYDKEECKLRINKDFFKDSTMECSGTIIFDSITLLKTNFIVFPDYKLDTVAREVLKDNKIELESEHEDNFEKKTKVIEDMFYSNPSKLIEYNFKDSVLVSQIIEKLNLISLMMKRSIITGTPFLKVKSPIAALDIMYLKKLHKKNLIANSNFNYSSSNQIEGAYVITPKKSFYKNIFVLDFKSLYPSIIMTFNIDTFSHNENGQIEAPNEAKFDIKKGILPELIYKIYKERDIAKKENDEIKSYALKITMNSFYGAVASNKSRLHNRDVGGAITAFARFIIQKAEKYIEELGHNVVYGDSVIGESKVLIKHNNKIKEIEIKKLFNFEGVEYQKQQPNGTIKYYKKFNNIETLTMNENYENVWKPLKFVMKHKTSKKLYKININNQQSVTVTSDHSLINYDFYKGLEEIKPSSATKIIYNPGFKIEKKVKNEPLAQYLGFWIGDGHIEKNLCNIRIAAGKDSTEFVDKVIKKIDLFKNSKIYMKPKGDIDISKKQFVNKMLSLEFKQEWTSKTKRIPKEIFNKSYSFKCNFIKGLFSSDGTVINKKNSSTIRYTSINVELIKDIQKLLLSVGISSSYFKENNSNKYKNKKSNTFSYHLVISSKSRKNFMKNIGFIQDRKNKKVISSTKVKKIISKPIKSKEILNSNCNVYDISVEKYNRFYANNILVKNTDSIFVKFNKEFRDISEKKEFGGEIQEKINDYFAKWVKNEFNQKNFLEIELEKIYSNFFIASKKRYVGFDEFKQELQFVGMEAIRGDWTELAKDFQVELVKQIFDNKSKDEIKKFILNYIKKLKDKELDDKLVYLKKITKPLHQYTKTTPPHVKAARELQNFEGRVVKYVITKQGPKHINLIDEKVVYDYDHYIEKQLKGVSDDLLEVFGINFEKIFSNVNQKSLNRFF